jgi:hypothetical protein
MRSPGARAGITRGRVYLQRNQDGGNVLVVHAAAEAAACLESKDPVQATWRSAASAGPCGRWFKDSLREFLAPFTGLGQRGLARETAWDWARNMAVASPGGVR